MACRQSVESHVGRTQMFQTLGATSAPPQVRSEITAPTIHRRLTRVLAMLIVAVASAVMVCTGATTASAAAPVTVSGTVTCANSSVVGVWIQAESSSSGWARWNMPIRLGGLNQADYSFTLNNGGRYQVHVGCGGSSSRWALDAKSGYVGGSRNSFLCNDIPSWLQWAGNWAFGVTGLRFIRFNDLPAYGSCKSI